MSPGKKGRRVDSRLSGRPLASSHSPERRTPGSLATLACLKSVSADHGSLSLSGLAINCQLHLHSASKSLIEMHRAA